MSFERVHALKSEFSVSAACSALGQSRSGYYEWASRRARIEPSEREAEQRRLEHTVMTAFDENRGVYGRPRMQVELREKGIKIGANRLRKIMRKLGLRAKPRRKHKRTTLSDHDARVSSNLLDRDFSSPAPNRIWVSDITYIRTWEGWVYACFIIDLFSRKVVGWAVANHMRADLVTSAFDMAVSRRCPPRGLIFHSDRGSQYVSKALRRRLRRCKMLQSMSRAGDCWDNAVAESFHDKLKAELVFRHLWPTRASVKPAVADYVERFYNPRRKHSSLNYLSPDQFENQNVAAIAVAA